MIPPTLITKQSPFLGEECALCKELLSPGDEIVICPEDSTRHHIHCWRANGNRCCSYGCAGAGEAGFEPEANEAEDEEAVGNETGATSSPRRWRLSQPQSQGCAQSCLILSVAVAILLIAFSCFGLWAMADYIMMEVLGWQYRAPLTGMMGGVGTAVFTLQLMTLD